MNPHAFVMIQYNDPPSLGRAILQINATRRQRFFYRSMIVTAVRRDWIGLMLGEGGGLVDHLLLRNLSGQLRTTAFELRYGGTDAAYRLHQAGRTVSAFESNLPYYVNSRLRILESAQDVAVLDLGEPIERFVLKRYYELQHPSLVSTLSLRIPDVLQAHYSGDAVALVPLLVPGIEPGYVSSLLAPGFNPQTAFEGLAAVLDLPFIHDDVIRVVSGGQTVEVSGLEAARPATWQDILPAGWHRMPALPADLAQTG
ncbi:MAG: hypothetical protein JXN59_04465 [Anaerolineae bacterium]|nr:hypothetical protein [Anaerolineae bacterium]